MSLVTRPPLTLGTQYANWTCCAIRSVVMVCHPNSAGRRPSRVTLALKETQTSTIGVAAIPLKRDDVTDV